MLNLLKRIAQDITSARDLGETLEMVVQVLPSRVGAEVCSVFLWDDQARKLVLSANKGFNREVLGKVTLEANQGIIAVVAKREEPLNIANAKEHPAFHQVSSMAEGDLHGMLAVPIIHHRKLHGVMVVQKKDEALFEASHEAFLVTVSAQLASAIAHADAAGYLRRSFFGQDQRNVRFEGVAGANGVAIGTAVLLTMGKSLETIPPRLVKDIDYELAEFENALAMVRADIELAGSKLSSDLRPEERALFDVYLGMLDDEALAGEVKRLIHTGIWAQGAIAQVATTYSRHFEEMEDLYLRERGTDIRDLARRLISYLADIKPIPGEFPKDAIIIGAELTPAILAEVPEDRVAAIVSVSGSANSHIAIIARALGIPTVMGLVDIPFQELDGEQLVVDGYRGHVYCNLTLDKLQHFEAIVREEKEFVAGLEYLKNEPCETLDQQRFCLQVNTGLMTDVYRSLDQGAEGVGLYRTEVSFMMRDRFPSESEQAEIYRQQLQAFAPNNVCMRTLDIGGDKSLSYFPIQEENPFLGWRGVRVTLDHPEIFIVQVRAMIRASEGFDNLSILIPMVSSIGELEEAMHLIYRAMYELQEEGYQVVMPRIGMMIEIPANVYQIRDIAARVDFISVGSNDLTQYLLAVDRTNPRVASLYNNYHPAVLMALQRIYQDASACSCPVSICGELAGDPIGVILLAAMGFRNLSMSPTSLLRVKALLRQIDTEWARDLLNTILQMDNPLVIRSTLEFAMKKAGLSLAQLGIVKPG
ncbi:phosphoenolpyruvate--protein phosphotransferase [Gynuella sp.]|uniref:phosphoenolpyruvate--protein phosphotransferase n=1 Tax=Gynuella sp. TaxID=2969146 RepID=UPI003D0C7F61